MYMLVNEKAFIFVIEFLIRRTKSEKLHYNLKKKGTPLYVLFPFPINLLTQTRYRLNL
jgi:hypothetical protein